MQHNIQKRDGQGSSCASWHAGTYFLGMKCWTWHIQSIALLDASPLEHREITPCFKHVCVYWVSPTAINIKKLLEITFRFDKSQVSLYWQVFFVCKNISLDVLSSSGERWEELTKVWWGAIVHRHFRGSASMKSSKCRALPNSVPAVWKNKWLKFIVSIC